MKRTTLIAAALAALIMATGFAAAAPGSAPVSVDTGADSTDEQPSNDHAQPAEDRDDRSENGSADTGADDRRGQGPAVDLPAQVPDHVSEIHDRISSFLSGDLETSLGDAISEVTPDDESDADDESDDTEAGDESDESDVDDTDDEDSEDADDTTDDEQPDEDDE